MVVKVEGRDEYAVLAVVPYLQVDASFVVRVRVVLVVPEEAITKTIVSSFRLWIKVYHPDHDHSALANEHARQLTAAKIAMLEKRRQKRAA